MNRSRIIPLMAAVAILGHSAPIARGQATTADQPFLFAPPPAVGCDTQPVYIQPQGQVIMPSPPLEVVPLVPVPGYNSPRPAPLQGPMFAAPTAVAPGTINADPQALQPSSAAAEPAGPLTSIAPSGSVSPSFGLPSGPAAQAGLGNPILVPAADDQVAWEMIADVVSSYFTISREQQARRSGDAWAEGRIDTAYQSGATWLEPHRGDSVGAFNRWESTFQTIRRVANVRVIPDQGGFLVEVVVQKEVEDLPRPEHARSGAAVLRSDNSLPTTRANDVSRTRSSPRWIPLGRDTALETRMLADIHARFTGATTASRPSLFGW